jgi:hypothetical protein
MKMNAHILLGDSGSVHDGRYQQGRICHHQYQGVLLDVEWPGIQIKPQAS